MAVQAHVVILQDFSVEGSPSDFLRGHLFEGLEKILQLGEARKFGGIFQRLEIKL